MSLKIYLNILKTGVYLSFISVFLVFTNLLFPFITSKQIYFNILVEILMVVWLALVIKYPEIRPKKSYLTYGLAAFFGALLISTIFSVDFNLSFWGNIERMLGWFQVVHFFLYYLIIITVFRDWRDWRNLFIISLSASVLVCLWSLIKIPYSTIGNTAYVSGYAIFNIFFALILFFRRREQEKGRGEDWLVSSLYLASILILVLVMKVTHTRGAYVGLGVGFLLFFLLLAYYSNSRKLKIFSFSAIAAMTAVVILVFAYSSSSFVNNTPFLSTIAQISAKAVTFQTRIISWETAVKDFPHHPILGAGYGNFAITFDKYFDPSFYNYTTSETYFDRAHNNLVDITSTAGLLGILTYLSIFAALIYYLFTGKKRGKISNLEFSLLISLFIAYFLQNLAVFDSLVTYISLMVYLGYVYWLINGKVEVEPALNRSWDNKELAVLAAVGILFLTFIYQYNIKVYWMLDGTIAGQAQFAQGNLAGAEEQYKQALSFNTPLDRQSRASFINSLNGQTENLLKLDKEKAKELADYAVSLAEANVKLNPLDSMMQMQLAQVLNSAALVYQADAGKAAFYSNRALEAIDKSINASPGRVTIYFAKAQIYISRNDKTNAINTLKYAFSLNKNYAEAACYLSKAELYFKDEAEAYGDMDKCLDLGGAGALGPSDMINLLINHYTEKNDVQRLLSLYERLTALEPDNAKAWVNLSLLYAQTGGKARAIDAAQKAAELDPSLRAAAEQFINKLKSE